MIRVTCGIILQHDKVLVTQRSEKMKLPLKWEFPGGKMEQNETPENCLVREIKEELNIEIEIIRRLRAHPYHYETFSITLLPFISRYVSGEITLAEHKEYKWLYMNELKNLDWAPADIPVLEEFLNTQNDSRHL
jgi:8-oxo-dGTP diphosphatase